MHTHKAFPSIVGRFANFYGPSQQLYRIIPRTILSILGNKKLPLHGGGHSKRAFLFGDDVSKGIMKMISAGKLGATYHFSSNEQISIKDLVQLICNEMNTSFSEVVVETDDRIGKDKNYKMEFKKTSRALDWSPSVPLLQGLRQCIKLISSNYLEIRHLSVEYKHKE